MILDTGNGQRGYIERPDLLYKIEKVMGVVQSSKGAFVLLAGESGVGKTVLAEKVAGKAAAMGWSVALGECRFGDKGNPYRPMAQALQGLMDKGPSLKAYGPRTGSAPIPGPNYMPMGMNILLAGGRPSDGAGGAGPDQVGSDIGMERDKLFDHVADLLSKASDRAPVMIILDDIHQCSDAMLQMLHHLAKVMVGKRILFLGSYTPEEVAANRTREMGDGFRGFLDTMEKDGLSCNLTIRGLTVDETGQMLGGQRPGGYPEGLVNRIHDVSGGNPYFISEVAKGLSGKDLTEFSKEIEIPSSISELLKMRVDGLGKEAMTVLEHGAVMGNQFKFETLKASTQMEERALMDALATLTMARIIEKKDGVRENEKVAGDATANPLYSFRNNIMREVIYKDLSITKKRYTHKKVACAIESLPGSKGAVYDLAYHNMMAGDFEKAFDASLVAGENSLNSFAVNEAFFYLKSAIGMMDKMQTQVPDAKVVKLYTMMARVLPLKGHVNEAIEYLSKAIALSKGDGPEKAMAHILMGYIHRNKDARKKALEDFKMGARISKRIGDRSILAEAYVGMAKVLSESGSHDNALKYCQKAIDEAEAVGNRRLVAKVFNILGGSYCENKGDYETTIECLTNAIDNTDPETDLEMLGDLYNNTAYVNLRIGDYDEALALFEKSMDISERTGSGDLRVYGLGAMGETLIRMGRPYEAKPYLEKAIEELKRMENVNILSMVYMSMGMYHNIAGEFEKAEKWFNDALEMQGTESMPFNRAIIHYEYGKALKAHCQDAKAIKQFKVALILFKKLGYKLFVQRTVNELKMMGLGRKR